jgi:uncharacterized protein
MQGRSFQMKIKKCTLAKAPSLLVYEESIERACSKGTILFYHGLGASKDIQLQDLKNLAMFGFLVIGIDNIGHGERRFSDFDFRFSPENPNRERDIQLAVYETAQEIPQIVDALFEQSMVKQNRLGITGISMGGFITYRAILEEKRFNCAVSILGSPLWENNSTQSPHLSIGDFFPIPLLSLNAGSDHLVPVEHARTFHHNLKQYYKTSPEKICYIEYPDADHFMPQHDWDNLWKKMVEWFEKWLNPPI